MRMYNIQICYRCFALTLISSTIGGYLNLCPEVGFVVEDNTDVVVGVAVAAANAKEFRRRLKISWVEAMRTKYPVAGSTDSEAVKVC